MNSYNAIRMSFCDIKPFIRYARYVPIDPDTVYLPKMSYEYRMFYVFSGTGTITVNNQPYPSTKGDFFLFGPTVSYYFAAQPQNPLLLLNFYFDFTFNHSDIPYYKVPSPANEFDMSSIRESAHFEDAEPFNKVIHINGLVDVEDTLLEIVSEEKLRKKHYDIRMSHLFSSILFKIFRILTINEIPIDGSKRPVDSILDYIHKNYNQNLTNKQIASHFCFHPNYINRIVGLYTGVSLHQYLLNVRINKAVELIQNTNKSLTEISEKVGYGNINHFSKMFKKKVGYCPSRLRKRK